MGLQVADNPCKPLTLVLAEGVGFEPTELSFNGFQDRRLQPLGHPSGTQPYVFILGLFSWMS